MRALTAAQERALKAGNSFKECSDCPEMVVAPAGHFMMGSPEGQGIDIERPQHEVTIATAFRGGEVRADFRRMGRLRRPWRLRPACQRQRVGARPAAGDQRELGRCADLCEMALHGSPASPIGCSPRPSTNMRRAPGLRRNIPGATTSSWMEKRWPIATAAAANGTASKRRRSAHSLRTRSVSTIWSATSGSGRRIAGTPTTRERRPTVRPGRAAIAIAASSAAVPGRRSSQPPLGVPRRVRTGGRRDDLGFRVARTLTP